MNRKPLSSRISNDVTLIRNDWVVQDRFLNLNLFFYLDYFRKRKNLESFEQAVSRANSLLNPPRAGDLRVKHLIRAAVDRIDAGCRENLPQDKVDEGYDALYDVLIRPFYEVIRKGDLI